MLQNLRGDMALRRLETGRDQNQQARIHAPQRGTQESVQISMETSPVSRRGPLGT